MITVTRIKALMSSDIVATLSENDDSIINDLIIKNDAYIVNLLGDIEEDVKDYLVEQLTLADLYKRLGYTDIAETYTNSVNKMISQIGSGKIYKKETTDSSEIKVVSREQIFTEEEFEKW